MITYTEDENDENPTNESLMTEEPMPMPKTKPIQVPEAKSKPEVHMNEGQKRAYDLAVMGDSFFLTGPGGSGKSFVLSEIRHVLQEHQKKQVAVTALTGCAALLLGNKAKTLHAWAGIGLAREPATALIQTIRKSPKSFRRWLSIDTLIVDEVSMMTPDLLEKLNTIAQAIRRNTKPMGGIQVIFVGDFFQLPPVNKESRNGVPTTFIFESPLWQTIMSKTIELTKIERQQDPIFHTILMEARKGSLSEKSLEILKGRQGLNWNNLEIKPTLLFSRKAEVDHVNQTNLKALTGERRVYTAKTEFIPVAKTVMPDMKSEQVHYAIQRMDRDAQYSTELVLAVGAQVMLLVNMDFDLGLVNGSRGVVVDFTKQEPSLPIVKFRSGNAIPIGSSCWYSDDIDGLTRVQVPLRLAYALTIHKAQGATLDCALIDIGESTFECGQAYVALSRVRSIESLYIWDLEKSAFKTHEKVLSFYNKK